MVVAISANSCWNLFNFRLNLIKSIIDSGHKVIAIAPRDSYAEEIERIGVQYVPISFSSKSRNPFLELIVILKYFLFFIKFKPDYYLSFTAKPNIYGGIAAKLTNISVINNIAGLGVAFMTDTAIKALVIVLYRFALIGSKHIFFQNENDKNLFFKLNITNIHNTSCLPGSGVDLSRFKYSTKPFSVPTNKVSFILFARMIWQKGVREYVDAARYIKSIYPSTTFTLMGFVDVDNVHAIPMHLIDKWVDAGHVTYCKPTDTIELVLDNYDCVVLPSYYPEGVPKSLLEAAATGRPIITTNTNGCREVVIDGKNGYLCDARSVEDLINKLKKFIELAVSDRAEMGSASRLLAEKNFDERLIIEAYKEIIK